uniref:Uncharacterized protein n=1 Tax=Anguilla anguilla TaxID=7936 RepID=A0A0E9PLT1_ANGAN
MVTSITLTSIPPQHLLFNSIQLYLYSAFYKNCHKDTLQSSKARDRAKTANRATPGLNPQIAGT